MRHPVDEAHRWLKQAEHDLEVAVKHIESGFFSDACYSAEQAAQKALKGYLYYQGARSVWKHSIKELVEECLSYDKKFSSLLEMGKTLDQYYIPTRYPDALAPPAVPFEIYTRDQAEESVKFSKMMLEAVKGGIR